MRFCLPEGDKVKILNGKPGERIRCPECGYEFKELQAEQEYLCPCGRFRVYVGNGTPSWLDLRIPPGSCQTLLTEFLESKELPNDIS